MLTMKAKYALRALSTLARHDHAPLPAHQLAERARVPESFLEVILSELRRVGYVSSKRGLHGGHQLAKASEQIGLGDLIRAIDGPLAPIRCASLTAYRACSDCPDPDACATRMLMTDVRNAIADVLDRRTLRDQLLLESIPGDLAA
jgi:Rrf2 family protein